jgi:hypothetical protein
MDRDILAATSFMVLVFLASLTSHVLYVKGYAFKIGASHMAAEERALKGPYEDQMNCEHASGTYCEYMSCEDMHGQDCPEDSQQGWYPVH